MYQNVSTLTNKILSNPRLFMKINNEWHNARLDKVTYLELDPKQYGVGATKTEFTFIVSSKNFYEVVRFTNENIFAETSETYTLDVGKARMTGSDTPIQLEVFSPCKPPLTHRLSYEQAKKHLRLTVLRENNHISDYSRSNIDEYFDDERQVITFSTNFDQFIRVDFKNNNISEFDINDPTKLRTLNNVDNSMQYINNMVNTSKIQVNGGVVNNASYVITGNVGISSHMHTL